MSDESIHQHIEAAASRPATETSRLITRIVNSCWPGGADDRVEPGALGWISRWVPAKSGATIPTCSCAAGRCFVCN
jgi:hypothetical protein